MDSTEQALAERVVHGLDDTLDHVSLRRQASTRLRTQVAFDLAVWAVLDPATIMWGSCVVDNAPRDFDDLENAVFENEYRARDVLKLVDLAAGPGIGTLCGVTGGDPAISPRYRQILAPRGFTDELRLVMHDGRSAWGLLCLLRAGGSFDDREVDALAGLGQPFATTLRRSLVRGAADVTGPAPAGLILATATGRILDMADDARRLLDATPVDDLPLVIQAVAARRAVGRPASAACPTRDGRWLAFHASALGDRLAVVVELVRPHQLADLVVRSRGLTPCEQEVLAAVARGRPDRMIARELMLPEHAMQDHLRSVFAKFDVGSRTELVAALFFEHFAPLHAADSTV
jgi:DNA-binding CsgD family transcriptional regulator